MYVWDFINLNLGGRGAANEAPLLPEDCRQLMDATGEDVVCFSGVVTKKLPMRQ